MMDKILVTGASGFVGYHLVQHLRKNNYSVVVLLRPSSDTKKLKKILNESEIVLFDGDVASLADVLAQQKITTVAHLASLYIAEHQASDIDNLIDSNVRFGLFVLEAMNIAGVRKLLNVGTSWQNYHGDEYNPVNLYAATKQAFEDLIQYYVKACGFRCITLRLFDTYGENDERKKLIQLLIETALWGQSLDMSPGGQKIDLCHVDDICHAMEMAINQLAELRSANSLVYGTSSGSRVTLKELVRLVEQVTGKSLTINWGARNYRNREVMEPCDNYAPVPGWLPKVGLQDGIARVYNVVRV